MRHILATAVLLSGWHATASAEENPFGADEFQWTCEATVERDASRLTGSLTVSAGGTNLHYANWTYSAPIQIDNFHTVRPLTLTGYWSLTQHFRDGNIQFLFRSEQRLPRSMYLSFDSSFDNGGFIAALYTADRHNASARLSFASFLRWIGDDDMLTVSVGSFDSGPPERRFLGTGQLPTDIFRHVEQDLVQLRSHLEAKARNFQNECTRFEVDHDAIII